AALFLQVAAALLGLEPGLLRGLRRARPLARLRLFQGPGEEVDEAGRDGLPVLMLAPALAGDQPERAALVDAVGQLRQHALALGVVQRTGAGDVPGQLNARGRRVHVLAARAAATRCA